MWRVPRPTASSLCLHHERTLVGGVAATAGEQPGGLSKLAEHVCPGGMQLSVCLSWCQRRHQYRATASPNATVAETNIVSSRKFTDPPTRSFVLRQSARESLPVRASHASTCPTLQRMHLWSSSLQFASSTSRMQSLTTGHDGRASSLCQACTHNTTTGGL